MVPKAASIAGLYVLACLFNIASQKARTPSVPTFYKDVLPICRITARAAIAPAKLVPCHSKHMSRPSHWRAQSRMPSK